MIFPHFYLDEFYFLFFMKFLVVYQEAMSDMQLKAQRDHVVSILGPAFEAGLVEDVIFIISSTPRPCEILNFAHHTLKQEPASEMPVRPDLPHFPWQPTNRTE